VRPLLDAAQARDKGEVAVGKKGGVVTGGLSEWIVLFITVYQWPGWYLAAVDDLIGRLASSARSQYLRTRMFKAFVVVSIQRSRRVGT
jgi:hypothetical protein